jgi:hypothetical protein
LLAFPLASALHVCRSLALGLQSLNRSLSRSAHVSLLAFSSPAFALHFHAISLPTWLVSEEEEEDIDHPTRARRRRGQDAVYLSPNKRGKKSKAKGASAGGGTRRREQASGGGGARRVKSKARGGGSTTRTAPTNPAQHRNRRAFESSRCAILAHQRQLPMLPHTSDPSRDDTTSAI